MRRVLAVATLLTALAGPAGAWNENAERCYRAEGDLEQVIAACTRALDSRDLTNADRATTFYNRASAHRDKGDHDRAIADYGEAIRLTPGDAFAFNNRGNSYRDKGEYDRAITDYSEAIRLKPDFAEALNNRGSAYKDKGDHDRAIADYSKAIRLKPADAFAFNKRGIAYGAKGDHDRAIADYDEAIRLKPDFAFAFNNRGIAYGAKGDHDRAIADYDEAIRLRPDYAFAFNNRGWTYERKGDLWRAERDYRQALVLDPDYTTARRNLSGLRTRPATAELAPPPATAEPAPSSAPPRDLVERVQRHLNALGFDAGPVDGIAGRRTRDALIAFQRGAGLPPDGGIGEALLARLDAEVAEAKAPPPVPEPDTTPPVISVASERLEIEAGEAGIEGTVADDRGPVHLFLDGRGIEVGAGGRFRAIVAVAEPGTHRKTLRAEDAAGNRAERAVTIVRRPPPTPPQEPQVAAAMPAALEVTEPEETTAAPVAAAEPAIKPVSLAPPSEDVAAMRAERRVALVIGNGAYRIGPLRNPPNDARDVAAALRGLGFEVIERLDVDYREMLRAVIEFGRSLQDGGIGLFYYAGHGIQVGGRNYLIPTDATIEREEYVPVETVDADQVLARMDAARNRLNIVVLDACRDNPYARAFRGVPRGLAQALAPSGTFLAYATAPGDVASDGEGKNSPYTEAMLAALEVPGLTLEELFKRVRVRVRERTGGRQTPWTSSSIVGDFYFRLPEEPEEPAPKPVASADYGGQDAAVWQAIRDSDGPLDFRTFIEVFPDSPLVPFARSRLRALGGE